MYCCLIEAEKKKEKKKRRENQKVFFQECFSSSMDTLKVRFVRVEEKGSKWAFWRSLRYTPHGTWNRRKRIRKTQGRDC